MIVKSKTLKTLYAQRHLYLLLLPAFVILALFSYQPMYGAIIAFKNYNPMLGIWGSKWAGFTQFTKLFNSIFFWRVISNTVLISLYHLAWGFPMPIILALLLNEIANNKVKRVVQTVTYLPHFLSWVIIGGFVFNLLSPSQGVLAGVAKLAGLRYDAAPLADPRYFRTILVASSIWQNIGWGTILFLAAITGIDPELYDAADIDGAGRFTKMLNITLPGIMPTIATLLILRMGGIMSSNFEQIFVLYSPSVYSVGDVISTYVYREGIGRANFSYTTAMDLFRSVINFGLIVITNRISRALGRSMW
ncbi:MAG: ABC transporter permease subunit [Treponema sp.]|nr:ABC transporter permease subunit [Treponema sp.]